MRFGGFGIGRWMERERERDRYVGDLGFWGEKGLKERKLKFVCYFYEPLGVFLGSSFLSPITL